MDSSPLILRGHHGVPQKTHYEILVPKTSEAGTLHKLRYLMGVARNRRWFCHSSRSSPALNIPQHPYQRSKLRSGDLENSDGLFAVNNVIKTTRFGAWQGPILVSRAGFAGMLYLIRFI